MHKIKRRILRRMTSFGRTKVKKTSKSIQVYRIRESPFSKGLQEYTRVSLAIKKIPDDEELGEIKCRKQGVFKQFKRLKFVFYDRVTTNDEP